MIVQGPDGVVDLLVQVVDMLVQVKEQQETIATVAGKTESTLERFASIITTIIIITRPKPAYGRQGLAGVPFW